MKRYFYKLFLRAFYARAADCCFFLIRFMYKENFYDSELIARLTDFVDRCKVYIIDNL